jgi:signal transduction histidine kinase
VLEFIVILATQWGLGAEVVLWFIEKLIFLAGLIFLCGFLNELYKCGKNVAEGNMDYEVNTKGMPSQFVEHAENLRSLSATVNKAVEQRMVSERMKTELITNVSHDLKTPLTSLINYSDLICRESCDNPRHGEYAEVLNRQSQRMKRLIDDLVEASKASSGSMDIELAPLRADVLLSQAAGEYEERLTAAQLTPVITLPAGKTTVLADGRLLWRIFDNMLNNIVKYSQPGTRVYLAVENSGDDWRVTFKNISREPLNIAADELMERFVRGDASRTTEGNGLGLSIAQSLADCMNADFALSIDGDLFRVSVTLKKYME